MNSLAKRAEEESMRAKERMGEGGPVKKIELVRIAIIKMFAYSAIKIKAKLPLLYSTLNPETNSDSPSAKSKGVRFVSARREINQRIINKGVSRAGQIICVYFIVCTLKERQIKGKGSSKKIILTS
jgi:hypothetical protein